MDNHGEPSAARTAPTGSAAGPMTGPMAGPQTGSAAREASGQSGRRTQAQRRAAAESALLAAAARLIAEHGSAGVTLARVGEAAGFSRGLATHYFGSKAVLLARLQEVVLADATASAVPERAGGGAVEELLRFTETWLEVARHPTDLQRALLVLGAEALAGASELAPAVAELDARMRLWVASVVRQGAAAGQVRAGVDPEAFAVVAVAVLKGLVVQAAAAPGELELTAAGAEARRWIAGALAP
ncbi:MULTISPECIES: TetR/AcrR family transcriptional regulator [unclassified Kitasatospora]|uniref:TetR/AcrR family transcriptional regulator n=1 Tax=unclassified Kitasatospora TaxID=2633591 RepID=UPI00382B2AB0